MEGSSKESPSSGIIIGGGRKWEHMSSDMLTHIFSFLCMADIIFNVPLVCKSWQVATTNPNLWKTLDLEVFFHKVDQPTRIYHRSLNKTEFPGKFRLFLESFIKYTDGDIHKLLLPVGEFLRDVELIPMALRTENLKFLYIPECPRITQVGLAIALEVWSNLESILISFLFSSRELLFQFIGEKCKNVSSFKFNIHNELFDDEIAFVMTNYLPGLKILTILCLGIDNEALEILLDGLKNLKELYISEMVDFGDGYEYNAADFLRTSIVDKTSRLDKFHFCRYKYCLKCPIAPGNNLVIKE